MVFGDDWPGVFIRGDNALYFASVLRRILSGAANDLDRVSAADIVRALEASHVESGQAPQRMLAFDACRKG